MGHIGSTTSKAAEPFTTVHRSLCWELRELRPDDIVLETLAQKVTRRFAQTFS